MDAVSRGCRFDKEGKTTFITAFYAVPTGVGRSRLLIRYARAVAPWFNMPRWLFGIFLNSFLVRPLAVSCPAPALPRCPCRLWYLDPICQTARQGTSGLCKCYGMHRLVLGISTPRH